MTGAGDDVALTALVDRCLELGMTPAEVDEAGDDLVEVAVRRAYGLGQEDLTLDQVVERSGIDRDRVEQIFRASGVVGDDLDEPIFGTHDVEAVKMFSPAEHPFSITALGAIEMKGISEPVELVAITRAT